MTMRCSVAKRELVSRTRLVDGLSKAPGEGTRLYSVPNRLWEIGERELRKRPFSPHRQYSKSHYPSILRALWSTKPTRLPVRCSCQRKGVSVPINCTTTSGRTLRLISSFSQPHLFVLHHGTYIPYSVTLENILTSKNGEVNTSS